MQEGRNGTYILNVKDGGRDWSAFSMQEGRSSTYNLNIEDGGRDWSVFGVQEGNLHSERQGQREGLVSVQHAGGMQQHLHSKC
jgi:hypothetical protein